MNDGPCAAIVVLVLLVASFVDRQGETFALVEFPDGTTGQFNLECYDLTFLHGPGKET